MHPVDHLFILLLFIVLPVYGVFETRRYEARESAGEPFDRIRFYRHTAIMEWTFFAALAIAWIALGRPIADLGFTVPDGVGFVGGAAVFVLAVAYLVYAWRSAKQANASEKARQLDTIAEFAKFVPQSSRELRSFVGVSITAGIVEEIVYRGFVIWYLSLLMPLWPAVAVSSVAFGLAHSYQGLTGTVRTGLVGLAFGVFYVVTGSIWLPIIGHVLLDVLQGLAIRELYRGADDALEQ
jgi:membrane protease YdiL (CAAX protease family)